MNIYRIISEALLHDAIAIKLDSPADESIIDRIARVAGLNIVKGFALLQIDGCQIATEVDTIGIERAKPSHQAIHVARFDMKDMLPREPRAYRFNLDLFYNKTTRRFELYRLNTKISPDKWQDIIFRHQKTDKYRT